MSKSVEIERLKDEAISALDKTREKYEDTIKKYKENMQDVSKFKGMSVLAFLKWRRNFKEDVE